MEWHPSNNLYMNSLCELLFYVNENYNIYGYLYGYDDGSWYDNNDYADYCLPHASIREYYCDGLNWAYEEVPCNTTGNYTWCDGGYCR